jgi:drug/metabolite transporter (DMT)-like permease
VREAALIALSLLVIAALAAVIRGRRRAGRPSLLLVVLAGLFPGVLGAVVILAPETDLVPDQYETAAWAGVVAVVAAGAILVLVRRRFWR